MQACDPPDDCPTNFVKLFVGLVNVGRGIIGVAGGATTAIGSEAAAVAVGPVSLPGAAVGTAKVGFGLSNISRGMQQLSEATSGGSPSLKNLLGLLPFGREFDDPAEPGPVEFFRTRFRELADDPTATLKRLFEEFFAINDRGSTP